MEEKEEKDQPQVFLLDELTCVSKSVCQYNQRFHSVDFIRLGEN